ncbi:MAG: hypothetical protein M1355_04240 [Patescibacteria group bacterium]|nr:hypothetical protein [Patescibacteria group bacterium]
MNGKQLLSLLKNLQKTVKCYSCGADYSIDEIHLIGQIDGLLLMQMNCKKCEASAWVNFAVGPGQRITGHAKVTDLNANEKKPETEISADELMELHDFLLTYEGDFKTLFRKTNRF